MVAKGMSNVEIAQQLFISEATVRTHVSSILRKLHLANRVQAALYALQEGLATLDGSKGDHAGPSDLEKTSITGNPFKSKNPPERLPGGGFSEHDLGK